jgi:ankyrin repeat protein
VVRLLIDNGADISATKEDGETVLHLASSEGYEGVAWLLIDKGADILATAKDG